MYTLHPEKQSSWYARGRGGCDTEKRPRRPALLFALCAHPSVSPGLFFPFRVTLTTSRVHPWDRSLLALSMPPLRHTIRVPFLPMFLHIM